MTLTRPRTDATKRAADERSRQTRHRRLSRASAEIASRRARRTTDGSVHAGAASQRRWTASTSSSPTSTVSSMPARARCPMPSRASTALATAGRSRTSPTTPRGRMLGRGASDRPGPCDGTGRGRHEPAGGDAAAGAAGPAGLDDPRRRRRRTRQRGREGRLRRDTQRRRLAGRGRAGVRARGRLDAARRSGVSR